MNHIAYWEIFKNLLDHSDQNAVKSELHDKSNFEKGITQFFTILEKEFGFG